MASAGSPTVADSFGVISHPVRRTLLERLAVGESRVTELAAGVHVSRPAVSQHLRLMLDIGVVAERRDGRDRFYSLRREGLDEIGRWLARIDDARPGRRLGTGDEMVAQP